MNTWYMMHMHRYRGGSFCNNYFFRRRERGGGGEREEREKEGGEREEERDRRWHTLIISSARASLAADSCTLPCDKAIIRCVSYL